MKILYGIQGTGNGHLARARALVPALRNADIEMDFIFSGRAREDFFNMDTFGDEFRCFQGLSLMTSRGKLDTLKTVTHNNLVRFLNDVRQLKLDEYDLVLSDFEPVTAWAAKLKGKPSLGISHQCAFDYAIPKVSGYTSARLLMKIFAPTQHRVGLHWHHFDQPILPPLIEQQKGLPVIDNKILVYMGFEHLDDIIRFVKPFTDFEFHIYAKVDDKQDLGHIKVNPLSHEAFHRDLQDSAGVISNAGFELASECLMLGKKLLIKPLLGQYEQLSNALALQALKRATVINQLDQAMLEAWLPLPSYAPLPYPNVADALAQWLKTGELNNTQSLVEQLWAGIDQDISYDSQFGSNLLPNLIL